MGVLPVSQRRGGTPPLPRGHHRVRGAAFVRGGRFRRDVLAAVGHAVRGTGASGAFVAVFCADGDACAAARAHRERADDVSDALCRAGQRISPLTAHPTGDDPPRADDGAVSADALFSGARAPARRNRLCALCGADGGRRGELARGAGASHAADARARVHSGVADRARGGACAPPQPYGGASLDGVHRRLFRAVYAAEPVACAADGASRSARAAFCRLAPPAGADRPRTERGRGGAVCVRGALAGAVCAGVRRPFAQLFRPCRGQARRAARKCAHPADTRRDGGRRAFAA